MDNLEKLRLKASLAQVFSPSAPIDSLQLFAGRKEQISSIINAMMQRGQHVIVYGERGVGKTSICNILTDLFTPPQDKSSSINYIRINCDVRDRFNSIWNKIFREMVIRFKGGSLGFSSESVEREVKVIELIPKKFSPEDIRVLFQKLGNFNILVIDELDRVEDRETTTLLADTIKSLSDHAVRTTIVLVGVADSVEELIKEHRSIERALVQIHMPRMSPTELAEIVDKALAKVKMTIAADGRNSIVNLSQGLPHYTHLVGLYASQGAIDNDRMTINKEDVLQAVKKAVDNAQESIVNAYHKAIASSRKTIYAEVLLACALAPKDILGYFAAGEIRSAMQAITQKHYDIPAFSRHLNDFCDEKRGTILQKTGFARRFRFRFKNPLLQPFIIMNGLTRGLIRENDISPNHHHS